MNTLIIGGTSGLGLELGKQLKSIGSEVWVTGRHEPAQKDMNYEKFNLSQPDLAKRTKTLVQKLPKISTLVYAAGFFQDGRLSDLDEKQIEEMLDVGGRGLIYFVKAVLENQSKLGELITITSTSQWTPRQREPVYNFVKAGSGHFSNAMAEDGRIEKVLVAGPAGMRTEFWEGVKRDDLDEMLDPKWVADETMKLRSGDYKYRFAQILRQPPRVKIVETRQ